MRKSLERPSPGESAPTRRPSPAAYHLRWTAGIGLAILWLFLPTGCLFRKNKSTAPQFPSAPIRIVLLPFNVAPDNPDSRWLSLTSTILMAKELEAATDLEAVPLWQGVPAAMEALGNSRNITEEIAVFTASRVNARWATLGELSPGPNGLRILVDFIPVKGSQIAFRYEEHTDVESLSTNLRKAFAQFLRYLAVRPLAAQDRVGRSMDSNRLRGLAEALDREYGWFSSAEPGKAKETFGNLIGTDNRLARLLFNPATYPELVPRPANPATAAPQKIKSSLSEISVW